MISIITPTYNRKAMLGETIESIMKQSYQNFEIIIVDDASTDGTEKFVEKYKNDTRVRCFRNEKNMGPGYNRNLGFKHAKGDYVIFMDDDDYYVDCDFFNKAIQVFEENAQENIAFVSGNAYVEDIDQNKTIESNIGCVGFVDGIEFLTQIGSKYTKPKSTFTTVFNANVLKQADLYNMKMVNDYAIYLRALLYGNAYILKDLIGVYRIHKSNISSRIEKDFLIDNLRERVWVKDKLEHIIGEKRTKTWWNMQMLILLKYYLFMTNPSYPDGNSLANYILENSRKSLSLDITIRLMLIIYKPFYCLKKFKLWVLKIIRKVIKKAA